METRKIQSVGKRSYSISLLKSWVNKNNIKSHDSVYLREDRRNNLIVSLSRPANETKEISVNLNDIGNVSDFIVFCYVRNVDKLSFFWKRMDYNKIKEAKRILGYLEGYDIVKEDDKNLEISFLFNDISITVKNVMRRMLHLLGLMVSSLENEELSDMDDIEKSVDRLYHLSTRISFSCIRNTLAMKENGFLSEEEIFFYKDVLKKIERIADQVYFFRKNTLTPDVTDYLKRVVDYLNLIIFTNSWDKNLKKPSFSHPEGNEALRPSLVSIQDQILDIYHVINSIALNRKYFS
ncbi:MAG: hypothetical protein ACQEP1_01010 [Nanobdellota archaeon]